VKNIHAFCFAAVLLCSAGPCLAQVQAFPAKPITVVVPFAPGGISDPLLRMLGEKILKSTGQRVLIENRPGASGQIGANVVRRARPDGSTLFVANIASHAINPTLYAKLSYDPVKDFEPVTCMVVAPNLVLVPPAHPAKSVGDLVAKAKANPGKVTYASPSIGTTPHLTGEIFKWKNGIDIVHVPYQGAAPAMTDLMAGRLDFMAVLFSTGYPLVRDGRLRALAVSSSRRSPLLPNVPTMQELGFHGYDINTWFGLAAPAETPRPVVDALHGEFVKALRSPDVVEKLANMGVEVIANTPAEFAAMIKSETALWGEVVKVSGARAD
jgi:tripartite-type tricarboxylate transporter receptor subunit TctC